MVCFSVEIISTENSTISSCDPAPPTAHPPQISCAFSVIFCIYLHWNNSWFCTSCHRRAGQRQRQKKNWRWGGGVTEHFEIHFHFPWWRVFSTLPLKSIVLFFSPPSHDSYGERTELSNMTHKHNGPVWTRLNNSHSQNHKNMFNCKIWWSLKEFKKKRH